MGNLEIDVTLVEKAKQGDAKALEALCKSSMRTVYYVALKILKNEADAEDIMSDTMVTVVEKLNTLSEPAAYISWVNRITVNKCKNFLAKNKPVYLGDEEQEVIENAELENYNEEFLPEEFVLSNEKKSALMEIIKEKTTYAEMMSIIMFYYNGDSIKTIASEMNCAEITVKTRLASARKKIKNGLEDKFGKGVMLMATGLFVLGKALKAEASEMIVPETVANTAVAAATSKAAAIETTATEGVAASKMANPDNNALGKIGKEVGKEVVKNSLKTKIIIGIVGAVAAVGIAIGVATMGGDSGEDGKKGNEAGKTGTKTESEAIEAEKALNETYKLIYKTSDKVYYYANANEEIYEFSGNYSMDTYFYHNVTCVTDAEYNEFLMDINGKYIVEPGTYDNLYRMDENYFLADKDDMKGIIDYKGEVVIPLEYSDIDYIDYYKDEDVIYYIAENSEADKYYILSEEGKVILTSDKEISYLEADAYRALEGSEETLLYEGTLYSLETGKELVSGLDEGTYVNHMYSHNNKLTIYDASFKVKEVIEDFESSSFEVDDKGRPVVSRQPKRYLNEDYQLVEVEKEDNTNHTLANGDKYSSKIDEDAEIITIYDESGKELYTISTDGMSQIEKVYAHNNYLVIKYGFYDVNKLINPKTGEVIYDKITDFYDNDKNELTFAFTNSGSNAEYVVLGDDFTLELGKNYTVEKNKNGFWAYDDENRIAYEYDLNGKVKSEIKGVEKKWLLSDDCFMLMCEDGKSIIISNEDGKIIFELEYTSKDMSDVFFPYSHNEDNIGIIQLSDGLYNLEGKKLVELTME